VPQRQRLAGPTQQYFLMSDKPGEANGVHPNTLDLRTARACQPRGCRIRHRTASGLAPRIRDELGSAPGGAAWSVGLSRVMQLNNLDGLEVRCRLRGKLHHEHRSDAEVRRDDDSNAGSRIEP
jgi:hypothetical protein